MSAGTAVAPAQVTKIVDHIRRNISAKTLAEPLEKDPSYNYASVPLCVMDSVFSIGVRYEAVAKMVENWARNNRWPYLRRDGGPERTISDFLKLLAPYENRWEDMAREVFRNRQRTSSRGGILKAEATYRFCQTLQRFGVETLEQARNNWNNRELRRAITALPGQASGLTWGYYLILAGYPDGVKPDRMILRFVGDALGQRDVAPEAAEDLVRAAAATLRSEFPQLTASALDNKIWNYQRTQSETKPAPEKHCHGTN